MSLFLGIDTSNYTTSCALLENGKIIKNCKLPVTVKAGERGVRQSDAVFSHVKNLPEVMATIGAIQPDAVGVSLSPRDVKGSYMPCFLAGYAVASSLASSMGAPLYTFSHQAGHVRAALYSADKNELVHQKLIAFHVSGGTTEVLLYDNGAITCIGGTNDINAGQLIDRTGVKLGLSFPCGKALEDIADFQSMKKNSIHAMSSVKGLTCNFSGLENKVDAMIKNQTPPSLIAAFILTSIEKTLSLLCKEAMSIYGNLPIIFSGGVSSNRYLQNSLHKQFGAHFAEPQFSADNAAGTALLCQERYEECHKTS